MPTTQVPFCELNSRFGDYTRAHLLFFNLSFFTPKANGLLQWQSFARIPFCEPNSVSASPITHVPIAQISRFWHDTVLTTRRAGGGPQPRLQLSRVP